MSGELMSLLTAQHRRLVATVMKHIERDVYPALSIDQRRELREVVVRAAGVYHDTALDCLKAVAVDDTMVTNERLYELLEQIHREMPPKGRT